jgi:hypothetical protein
MYRFEVYSREHKENGTHYYWRLTTSGEDQKAPDVHSRSFASRLEAEHDAWEFRRGVRWARVEDDVPGPDEVACEDGSFRRVPNIISLSVGTPRRHRNWASGSEVGQPDHGHEAATSHESPAQAAEESGTRPRPEPGARRDREPETGPRRAATRSRATVPSGRPGRSSASRTAGRGRGRAT